MADRLFAAPDTGPHADPRSGSRTGPRGGRAAWAAALLATLTVVPAAAFALPDTTLNVVDDAGAALGLGPGGLRGLLRATGLSLPALLLAVPPAAVAARRLPARAVLLAGLLCLAAGVLAAPLADSVPLVAAVRAAQGAGAGVALPAALVLVWERRSALLTALWAGTLAAALLAVMPLALAAVPMSGATPDPVPWHTALAPRSEPVLAALAAALLCLVLRERGRDALPPLRHAERGQLVLPLVPAAGFAFLALMTTYDWSSGGQLVVAGVALFALVGLALVGSRDATAGSPLGCAVVMVTAGLFGYPVTAPLAGLAAAAAPERGTPPAAPFAAAALAALLGALLTVRLPRAAARTAVLTGHGLVVTGVLLGLAVDATGAPWALLLPLVPLGAGLGAALAASLRGAGVGAALFGLSLCFPAVLTGQLLVLSLQVGQLERAAPATEAQRLYGLLAGYRLWLVVAGVLVLALTAAWARAARAARAANVPDPWDG
ncbi:hypothetical protein ACSNOI_33140 [Actinomadura kijaniata]|uniref:hypothetical protein n=1 Tax=Actinomadura kijaniata TaxID=46161 RepID=UPI003F1A78AF